jgi:hypothetical protein
LYFLRGGVCEEALNMPKYKEIIEVLQQNSMETEELVLDYYERLSSHENMVSDAEFDFLKRKPCSLCCAGLATKE